MKLEAITHLVLRLVQLAAESGKLNQTRELFNTSDLTSNLCFMPDKLAWGQFRLEAYKSVRYKSQGTSRRTFEAYMPTRRASRRRKNGKRRIGCVRRNGIAIALWSGLLVVRCVRRNGIAIALWSGLLAVRCVRRNGIAIALWSGLFAVRCVRRNGIAIALWSGLLAVRCVRRNGIAIALWSGLLASRRTFEAYMPTRRASRRRKNGKRRIGCVRRNGIAIALWSGLLVVRCVRRNGISI
ncbi:hypothetical protein FF011L_26010 [Roseimaritima multifibrata]|uniref:Uncharacterized protein n=1 Tax=Roseimaritima multifibrata TaxID=1930274 RepID=A0A517MG20_9BACT|nr:hypothetical protein FF011L_26010 [Roseimaritima multifibrata]